MQQYSPFDRSIKDLQPSDLAVLDAVSEGWYVEYKSEIVNARALAKAVSAFANTYGGWLFLGVTEKSKDDLVAGSFPGIPDDQLDVTLQCLRQSTVEYLNPTPHFETKILRGPCIQIGLPKGRSLLTIQVPQSHTAPHVHKDGRIYRRVADSSEPKPETDRFVLDQLWRRADPIREMTRKWVARDPELSKAEGEVPYVRLLLCVDPWCQRDPRLTAALPEIRTVMTTHEASTSSVTFDTVYPAADGFIARQLKGNDPHTYALTWRIRRDLSCDIVFPLPLHSTDVDNLIVDLDGYEHVLLLIEILKAEGHTRPQIADLNMMISVLTAVVAKYRRLLKFVDTNQSFYFKARVINVWRILPFIDIDTILNECKQYGLPMIIDSEMTIPPGNDPGSFMVVREPKTKDGDQEHVISSSQGFIIFTQLARAFGLSIIFDDKSEPTIIPYTKLIAACDRAITVQRNRK